MIGDDSIFKDKPCAMSVKCVTPEGQLWVIKKQDFLDLDRGLERSNEEAFK